MPEQVGIEIVAKDKASNVLKKIGSTGGKSLEGLKKRANELPSHFGKMSAAMMIAGNSASQMGGQVASATQKVADLGAMVAVGGPVGIALAAGTAAIGLAAFAWNEYTEDARRAKQEQDDLNEMLRVGRERLLSMETAIRAVSDELSFMGMDAADVAIQKQAELVAEQEQGIRRLEEERDALLFNGKAFNKLTEEQEKWLGKVKQRIDADREVLKNNKDKLELMETLEGARKIERREEEEKIERERRLAEGAKRKAEADRKALEAKRQWLQALRTESEVLKSTNQLWLESIGLAGQSSTQTEEAKSMLGDLVPVYTDLSTVTKDNSELIRMQDQLYADLASTAGGAFAQMVTDSDNAGKHMLGMMLSMIEKSILAHAANAGAGAGSAVSAVPVIGPALIPAAIASAFALVRASLSQLPSFQFGGIVQGGTPNKDSVPILAMPGERVLNKRERAEYEGRDKPRGGQTTVILQNNMQSFLPGQTADLARATREQEKMRRKLQRRGVLRPMTVV